jgi:hypothetical protein
MQKDLAPIWARQWCATVLGVKQNQSSTGNGCSGDGLGVFGILVHGIFVRKTNSGSGKHGLCGPQKNFLSGKTGVTTTLPTRAIRCDF